MQSLSEKTGTLHLVTAQVHILHFLFPFLKKISFFKNIYMQYLTRLLKKNDDYD